MWSPEMLAHGSVGVGKLPTPHYYILGLMAPTFRNTLYQPDAFHHAPHTIANCWPTRRCVGVFVEGELIVFNTSCPPDSSHSEKPIPGNAPSFHEKQSGGGAEGTEAKKSLPTLLPSWVSIFGILSPLNFVSFLWNFIRVGLRGTPLGTNVLRHGPSRSLDEKHFEDAVSSDIIIGRSW